MGDFHLTFPPEKAHSIQMIWNSILPALLPVLCALSSCALAEHPVSAGLQQQLTERSKQGLALAAFMPAQSYLVLHYFTGKSQVLQPACCIRTEGHTISRNRIVMVDLTGAPALEPLRDPSAFVASLPAYGGPVVAMDTRGVVVSRSIAHFSPTVVSLSPDLEHFALMGAPLDHPGWPAGINIGAFHEKEPRSLRPVQVAEHYERPELAPVLDWSPDGKTILFSHQGSVSLVDVATGSLKEIARGAAATWSPSGGWIAYLSLEQYSEVRLLNLSTGASKVVHAGEESAFPIEWSPDGKYLLIRAGNDVSYGGHPWVYRVSDGTWSLAVPDYITVGLHWHWIQMENSQPHAQH